MLISENKLYNLFQIILALVIVFDMKTIYLYLDDSKLINLFINLFGYIAIIGCVVCSQGIRKKKFVNSAIILAILIVYLLVFYLISSVESDIYFYNIRRCLIPILYIAFCKKSNDDLLKNIVRLIEIIAVISLFFWYFGSLLNIIKPTDIVYSNWAGYVFNIPCNSYFNIYFETQKQDIFSFVGLTRNTAIFSEAPMASFMFSIALLYHLFYEQNTKKYKYLLITVAIITTLSTTGITVLVMGYGLKYIIGKTKNRSSSVIKALITPFSIIFALFIIIYFVEMKFESFSGLSRIDDIQAGFKAWLDSPFIGNGFNNIEAIQKYMSSFRQYNIGYSNTPLYILACGGIYLALPYVIFITKSVNYLLQKKNYQFLCFYLIFIYMLVITIVPYNMLTILLCGWFANNKKNTVGG